MNNETICAPATPTGGAIAIVRLSGEKAIEIAAKVFRPAGKHPRPLTCREGHSVVFGTLTDEDGNIIDECLLTIFRAPHSYTGEDSAEFSVHGSPYVVRRTIELLLSSGCRMARPGEFTRRAFSNGKMDLMQAEAVADLIASRSRAEHRVAIQQLRGGLSKELTDLRNQLIHFTALVELELDFSDHEDIEFASRPELRALCEAAEAHVARLLNSYRIGRALKEGVPVAIVGETNAGKSTLLNALAGEERAIVSDVHGTTRDTIEEVVPLHGFLFRFIDTAGLRSTEDPVEQLGQERTRREIARAAIVLRVVPAIADKQSTMTKDISASSKGKPILIVRSKADLLPEGKQAHAILPKGEKGNNITELLLSAKTGRGMEELKNKLIERAALPDLSQDASILTNARHFEALKRVQEALRRVHSGLDNNQTADFLALDLRETAQAFADLAGEITSTDVLSFIFGHFCIGK